MWPRRKKIIYYFQPYQGKQRHGNNFNHGGIHILLNIAIYELVINKYLSPVNYLLSQEMSNVDLGGVQK